MEILELTGKTVKSYEIGNLLGQGGYGVVYRAKQHEVLREVAIKVILPKHANSPEFIRRFESEAQVVARLEHPHIIPLYDYWREPDRAYLVMRYLRGGSLRDKIDAGGQLDIDVTGKVLEQVGSALTFAHRNGVVHRDVNANNILMDEDGNAYLGDFGIAQEVGSDSGAGPNAIIGTPAYLAPEQIRGGDVGPHSDIYAFGIMLYEMLSGTRPFAELTLATLVYKHLNEPLPMIDHDEFNLPPAFNSIIQKATAKDPKERYPDAQALVREFHQTLRHGAATVELSLEELDLSDFELLETKNPYKGLRAFQQADAADFFGRASMIQQVLDRLQEPAIENNFLAVIGPSGSGKSSLVKAGVLPALRQGRVPGSEHWFYAEMVPGEVPLEELAAALLSVSTSPLPGIVELLRDSEQGLAEGVAWALPSKDSRLVLMIDQFEEVFTQVEQEHDRQQFLSLILNAVAAEDSPVIIIATLRADFYDRPLLYQGFGELIRKRTELVLPLNNEELEETITGPAYRVGAVLEEGLVETIIEDVREQPGALPLLQYALTELFERRDGALLTKAAYSDIGGTLGALAKRAEEVYLRFRNDGKDMARQMFLRLVTLGEGQEDTRRRILQTELLTLGDRNVVEDVLDHFGRYRLLTFDRDETTRSSTVEVAHEALIRQWERLREWLIESREDIRLERQLLNSAEEWDAAAREKSYAMSGTRLRQFEEWARTTSLQLNQLERDHLEASLAVRREQEALEKARQEREQELERLKARNLRIAAVVFGCAAVVAIILSLVAFDQSNKANEQRAIAETERGRAEDALHIAEINERKNHSLALAANARGSLSEHDPALALPLAIEARYAFDPPEAEVLRTLGKSAFSPGPRFRFTDSPLSVLEAELTSDGGISVFAGTEGIIYLTSNVTGERIASIDAGSPITGLSISPDDELIAAGLSDGGVGLWNLHSGDEVHRLQGHSMVVTDVEFSPDGRMIFSSSADATLRVWDAETGAMIRAMEGHEDYIMKLSVNPAGALVASSSANVRVEGRDSDVRDQTVRIWDVATGENVIVIDPRSGYVRDVEFSRDGSMIAAATWDFGNGGTARVYDIQTGAETHRIYAHRNTISDVEFSPDNRFLATASADESVKIWDIERGVLVTSYVDFGERIHDISYSADGEYMLIALGNIGDNNFPDGSDNPSDSSTYLWDLRNRAEAVVFEGHSNWTWTTDISPDGATMASGAGPLDYPKPENVPALDTSVRLWDAETGQIKMILNGHLDTVDSVHFIEDGSQVLSAAWDGSIRRWDAATGEQLQIYAHLPDNWEEIATAAEQIDPAAVVAEAAGIANRGDRKIREVFMIDVLPDGQRFVSASAHGTVKLWDIDSGAVIRSFAGHESAVNGVNVSPDGALMLTASGDTTIRLWDIETGEELKQFTGHTSSVNYAKFAPNMEFLVSTSWDDTVRMWDMETGAEIRQFVGHAGNTFGIDITDDSGTLLTTSSDTSLRMWDTATGEEIHRFDQHTDWIQEVVFSPDETFAISAGQDNTLRRWRIRRAADDLIAWAQDNRYIRELSCAERESFRLTCEQQ